MRIHFYEDYIMFKKYNNKNFQKAIMPFHLITKLFGLTSYSFIERHGNVKYKFSTLGASYSFAFIFLFIGK